MTAPPLETGYVAWWSFRHAFAVIGLLAVGVVVTTAMGYPPVGAVLLLAVAVALTSVGLRRRGRVRLTIDGDAITDSRSGVRQRFDGAALIWVGRPHRRGPRVLNPPVVVTYTHADVAFARRSGARLRPASVVEVDPRWGVPALAAELRQRVSVPVVCGDQTSRRTAEHELLD